MKTQTYVNFHLLFSENKIKQVKDRNLTNLKLYPGVYCLELFDIIEETIMHKGKKLTLRSDSVNVEQYVVGEKFVGITELKRYIKKHKNEFGALGRARHDSLLSLVKRRKTGRLLKVSESQGFIFLNKNRNYLLVGDKKRIWGKVG